MDRSQPELTQVELVLQGTTVTAEIADDDEERRQGLMYREGLETDHGMLFAYEDEQVRSFWMKNTKIPLSIAFMDARGQIVKIADLEPLNEQSISSGLQARYALEMTRGWFSLHDVRTGQSVGGLPLRDGN